MSGCAAQTCSSNSARDTARARLQPAHAILLGAARGEHQDEQVWADLAEPLADLDAVEFRQHEVEQHQVVAVVNAALRGGQPLADRLDLAAGAAQQVRQPVPQHRLILDDQDFHLNDL
jgi:hypothetical protein